MSTAACTVVTGAAGFAGSHLLQHLAGRADLVAWTRRSPPPPGLAPLARWQQVDLLDAAQVRAAVRALQPAAIYHCAGIAQASGGWRDSATLLDTNVRGTHHLIEALLHAGTPCRLLVPGSALVYAPSAQPLDEQQPLAPSGPYAFSKLAQEQLALRAAREDGLDVIVTRSFNHTGARQSPAFVAPGLARQIALIERGLHPPVIRVGNLDAIRDISDVRDVVRAYALLMARGQPGIPCNVASGVGRSVRSLLDGLIARARCDVRVEIDPARLRAHDVSRVVGDATRLRSMTGWQPEIPFEETLDALLEYWRETVGG